MTDSVSVSRDSLLQGCLGREGGREGGRGGLTTCQGGRGEHSLLTDRPPNFTEVWSVGPHYTQVTWSSVHGRSDRLSAIQSTLPVLELPHDPTIHVAKFYQ